jgi:hypothetical protein
MLRKYFDVIERHFPPDFVEVCQRFLQSEDAAWGALRKGLELRDKYK